MSRFKVPETDVLAIRRTARRGMRNSGWVGSFIGAVLDVFIFIPMRLLARCGLLYGRTTGGPRRGGDGGTAGAGVGAVLPVIPPSLSGAAALRIPRDDA